MSKDKSLPYERKTLKMIMAVDPRKFKVCEATVQERWSHRKARNEKWLVHLKDDGHWNIRKLA
jgi:hypothetical protein